MADKLRKRREKLELKLMNECWIWFHNECQHLKGRFRRVKNELDDHPPKSQLDIMKQLNENKMTGVVPGTWDAFFMDEVICWFEFKVGNNQLSPEQEEFMEIGMALGWRFFETRNLDTFKQQIYGITE